MTVDPEREVLVTAGATEAVTAALLALCEVGDEVLTLEPTYDSYKAAASMAGAMLPVVPVPPAGEALDLDLVSASIGPRTRLLLLNSPHNPTGWVASTADLDGLAACASSTTCWRSPTRSTSTSSSPARTCP